MVVGGSFSEVKTANSQCERNSHQVHVPASAGPAPSNGDQEELLRVSKPSNLGRLGGEQIFLRLPSFHAIGLIGRVKRYGERVFPYF